MPRARSLATLTALLLLACGRPSASRGVVPPVPASPPRTTSTRTLAPFEAVLAAAEAATTSHRFVPGRFAFPVRATGRQDGRLYLNSELDYRDQRNLTIAVEPQAEPALRERLGGDPATLLVGRRIEVAGAAQRVTIWFWANGKRSDKYYFQTHVRVYRAEQLTVLPDSVAPAGGATRPGA